MNRNRSTGPIDKHPLARFVLLAQHDIELRAPALIQVAESGVAIAFWIRLPVLLPQQLQGHMLVLLQFLVNCGKVGQRAR
jgi:hypothetical protein